MWIIASQFYTRYNTSPQINICIEAIRPPRAILLNVLVCSNFIYEAILMKKHQSHETHKRTLVKSITWRIAATLITFITVIVFTQDPTLALSLSFLDLLFKFIGYYVHERAWVRVEWGIAKPRPKANK
jgi:uncharacterized membrane protein